MSGTTGVTTLVSTRIYPDVAPLEVVAPFIIIEGYDIPLNTQTGRVNDYYCTVNCYAISKTAADNIRLAVLAALERITPQTVGTNKIICSTCTELQESYINAANFDGLFNHSAEFEIWHS